MKPFSRLVGLAIALLFSSVPAAAQTPRPERPYRGLFGGGVGNTEQLLTGNLTLAGGYDDNVFAAESGSGLGSDSPLAASRSNYGELSGGLTYSLDRPRTAVGASLSASTRYYSSQEDFFGTYSGGVGASLKLSSRTTLAANQSLTYQPFFTLQLFPSLFDPLLGQPTPADLDYGIAPDRHVNYMSDVSLTSTVSRRGSVDVGYNRQRSNFEAADRDFSFWGANAGYQHQLAKGLGLRAGYAYWESQYLADTAGGRRIRGYTIDAGVDYSRALSFSRRTTLSFSTGSSAFIYAERTQYHFTGSAQLNHEIGRTWNASAAYHRGVGFVESFDEPVIADSLTAGLSGMITRRLQFQSGLGASIGEVGLGLGGQQNGFATYYGTLQLNYAVTRYLGLGVDYSYYRYSFDQGVALPPGITAERDRQSVRASLILWAPLLQRGRRPDAAR